MPFSILDFLETVRCEKLIFEFSLETYDSPGEQARWEKAISDLVDYLSNHSSRSDSMEHALDLYRGYQNNYAENQLFKYAIKALGCNSVDTTAILQALPGLFEPSNARYRGNPILTSTPTDLVFHESLKATQKVEIYQNVKWHEWEKGIGQKIEKKLIKETVKADGLLAVWDDGSLEGV